MNWRRRPSYFSKPAVFVMRFCLRVSPAGCPPQPEHGLLTVTAEFASKSKVHQGPRSKVQSSKSASGLWTLDFGPWTLLRLAFQACAMYREAELHVGKANENDGCFFLFEAVVVCRDDPALPVERAAWGANLCLSHRSARLYL